MGNSQKNLTETDEHVSRNAEDIKRRIDDFKHPSRVSGEQNKPVRLLVISSHADENFYSLFKGCKLSNGREIIVEQAGWADITFTSYSDSKCVCTLQRPRKPIPDTPQSEKGARTFIPDYLLIRNLCFMIFPGGDNRNKLFGMKIYLPTIFFLVHMRSRKYNSLISEYCMLDRPLMIAELIKFNRIYGQENFPIFPHHYYSSGEEMTTSPSGPLVIKIGAGHAGYGKMLLDDQKQFQDLKSVVTCTGK
ncbi:synapsin-2 [Reticulomyxa filosa]|uniref:Synapsin-2 n=1 Tax=Reticulomyxa filosa TaxID=46433 RepID=X6M203_RETFI|nr:synapsin-2 [Reticulomyxa filosa]|eukprot:ETO07432.1 synapsin-2 [Reticulomyxa filosa]